MLQSIASCWPLLCWNKQGNYLVACWTTQASYQSSRHLQNMIAMHAGKILYTSCAGKQGAGYSLKAVLTFQTLMLATLGKWATTHDRFFSWARTAKCSWTLLPGLTWLQMLITRIKHIYGFIKALRCLSTIRQATRYFKTMLKILVDRAVMLHISFLSKWYLLWSSINSCHNLYKWSVSSFLPYVYFFRIDILIFENWSKGTEQKKNLPPSYWAGDMAKRIRVWSVWRLIHLL